MHLTNIVDFEQIPTLVPDLDPEVVKNLSEDYKYNYKFCKAIAKGSKYFKDPKHHAMITGSPGKYHQARWLPLFNRTLRAYVQTPRDQVTKKLKLLVTFFTQVISPAWFTAIANPSFLDGPRNFHYLVSAINRFEFKEHVEDYNEEEKNHKGQGDEEKNQEGEKEEADENQDEEERDQEEREAEEDHEEEKQQGNKENSEDRGDKRKKAKTKKKLTIRETLRDALGNNSYYAHFESVVAAMMFDRDPEIRQRGLEEVLSLLRKQEKEVTEERRPEEEDTQEEEHPPKKKRRKSKKEPKPVKKVREYRSPEVDLTVANYWNFIDNTPESEKTMPPIFIGMSETQLRNIALDPSSFGHLKKIAGNTQNVERWIKNITQISGSVKSSQRREEEAANLQYSRIIMPQTFSTKRDYISHLSTLNFASQQPGSKPPRKSADKSSNNPSRILRSMVKKNQPKDDGLCAAAVCDLLKSLLGFLELPPMSDHL